MEKEIDFEEALKELETIIRSMENGQSKLEDSLANYEKGIKLANICEKRIKEAKTKLEEISVKNDGNIEKKDNTERVL